MKNKKRMVQYVFDRQHNVVAEHDATTDEDKPDFAETALAQGHDVYEILETGGFLKLYYKPHARIYWFAQALLENRVADWKIHLSVDPADYTMAWDILAALFIQMRCKCGLKIETQGSQWPLRQRGREITIYIYRFSEEFVRIEDEFFKLSQENEQSDRFWMKFISAIERAFAAAGIRTRGVADGDLAIGTYASLRNESFVLLDPTWQLPPGWSGLDLGSNRPMYVYPPNIAGHNAAQQRCPLRAYRKACQYPVAAPGRPYARSHRQSSCAWLNCWPRSAETRAPALPASTHLPPQPQPQPETVVASSESPKLANNERALVLSQSGGPSDQTPHAMPAPTSAAPAGAAPGHDPDRATVCSPQSNTCGCVLWVTYV